MHFQALLLQILAGVTCFFTYKDQQDQTVQYTVVWNTVKTTQCWLWQISVTSQADCTKNPNPLKISTGQQQKALSSYALEMKLNNDVAMCDPMPATIATSR